MSKRKQKLANDQEIFVNQFTPRTKKQSEFIDLINSREIVVAIGIAGSGKTITALASALNLLGNYYENIILVKSVITIPGEEVGFIPGGYEEKMVPHLMSYT
jgi:predicted ribonuclease YlaK